MKYVVVASPPEHYEWLVKRTAVELTTGFRAIEARDSRELYCRLCGNYHGVVVGMVGYCGWTPNSVTLHVALDKPLALREILKHAFEYPFLKGGRNVAIATVRAGNERIVNLCRHVGFKETYRVKDGFAVGEDIIVQELRKSDCRWLPKEQP